MYWNKAFDTHDRDRRELLTEWYEAIGIFTAIVLMILLVGVLV